MPAVAPDIALLRNELIRTLRAMDPPWTYAAIGDELGVGRQSIYKLIATYNLDDRGSRRILSDDEKRVLAAARKWGIEPPVPIMHDGIKKGRAQ